MIQEFEKNKVSRQVHKYFPISRDSRSGNLVSRVISWSENFIGKLQTLPSAYLPMFITQWMLRSSHIYAGKEPFCSPLTLHCSTPNAFLPLVMCQLILPRSHFLRWRKSLLVPSRLFFSAPNAFLQLVMCQLKLDRMAVSSIKTLLCSATSAYFTPFMCHRTLHSSHFYAGKGPLRSPQTLRWNVTLLPKFSESQKCEDSTA